MCVSKKREKNRVRNVTILSRRNMLVFVVAAFFLSVHSFVMCNERLDDKKACFVITLPSDIDDIDTLVDQQVDTDFVLNQLTYNTDIALSKKEMDYLLDVKKNERVSAGTIKRIVSYFIKKDKFEKITLTICPQGDGKHLHFDLQAFWTFKKVKFHGVLVGSDQYRKLYLFEPGDPFSSERHNHSMNKITEELKRQGYFEATVTSQMTHDDATKSVTVDITLNRGKRFVIGDVKFIIKKSDYNFAGNVESVSKNIDHLFKKRFEKSSYSKSFINEETRALKRFLSGKNFFDVDIELLERIDYVSKKVDLTFTLDLHSKKEFIFFGNSFFSDAELLDKIFLFGRSAWLVPASILSEEIAQAYHKKGFWNIAVESKEDPNGYFFLIKEGKRASIKQVSFEGVDHFDHLELKKECFSGLLRSKYFDADTCKKSLDKLLDCYLTEGFLDVKLLKDDFVPYGKKNEFTLVVTVDEGERSFLTSVVIDGFPELINEGPFVKVNDEHLQIPFDVRLLTEQREWLLQHFKNRGYLHATVTPELQKNGNDVSLAWHIEPGILVTFGKTILTGSTTFPVEYIMRELQYQEGDPWDNDRLKESIDRLRGLGIFEHAHLYPHRPDLQTDCKDLLLKLHNFDPFEVRVRLGAGLERVGKKFVFGQGFTYKIGGSFLWRNPGNVADQLVSNFDIARTYRNISAAYARPWIFNMPLAMLFKVYSNWYDQPGFVGCKEKLYEIRQEGFLVNVNRLYRRVDFSMNMGFEWMRTCMKEKTKRIANNIAKAINFDSCLIGQKIPYILLEPILLIDTVDNKLNPTFGSFSLISLKGMFPLSARYADSYFIKLLLEQSFFYPFANAFVGAFRLRFGHVFHQKFEDIMPNERFYLGGAHSIRSYEKDMCPPLGIFYDEHNCLCAAPRGGKTMVNVNMELRFPVYKAAGGVLFQDLGTLVGGDGFKSKNVLAATGLGLRFNTMVGPIRFDIAWKWRVRRQFESSYAWFLAFGNAF